MNLCPSSVNNALDWEQHLKNIAENRSLEGFTRQKLEVQTLDEILVDLQLNVPVRVNWHNKTFQLERVK